MTEREAFGLVQRIIADRERAGQPPVLIVDTYDDLPPNHPDKIPRILLANPATGELVPIVSASHYERVAARGAGVATGRRS